jgi:hypothetical protein
MQALPATSPLRARYEIAIQIVAGQKHAIEDRGKIRRAFA